MNPTTSICDANSGFIILAWICFVIRQMHVDIIYLLINHNDINSTFVTFSIVSDLFQDSTFPFCEVISKLSPALIGWRLWPRPIVPCSRHCSCKEILFCSVRPAVLPCSVPPFHLSATTKWVSPVHHLSVSMDTREEAVIAHTPREMPRQDWRVVFVFFFFFSVSPMHIWFWGLNVCMWGQMDTFMSAWVWIILQATSGAPHGTANCSERGRWACWRAPLQWAFSNLFDGASSQMAEQKVRRQSRKTNAFLCPHKHGAHPPLWKQWLTSVRGELVFHHCLSSVSLKDNYIDENQSVTLVINDLPPEVQLPVMWIRHHFITILIHC